MNKLSALMLSLIATGFISTAALATDGTIKTDTTVKTETAPINKDAGTVKTDTTIKTAPLGVKTYDCKVGDKVETVATQKECADKSGSLQLKCKVGDKQEIVKSDKECTDKNGLLM